MKKRLLALLLAIVIVVGLVVVAIPASAAQSETNTYDVGYAKADISPWIKDYPDTTNMVDDEGKAIGIPYDNSWGTAYIETNNLVVDTKTGNAVPVATLKAPIGYDGGTFTTVTDVNGDGMNGQGDGIYTTATSVTDNQGNTVLFLTLDAIAGYDVLSMIDDEIVDGVYEKTGIVLSKNCIYLNGSHTHTGIDPSRIYDSTDAPLVAYWKYYKQQIINAAVAAYENRTPATMSKGQIDASEASKLQMNFIRHYNTVIMANDVNEKSVTVIGGPNFGAIGERKTKENNLYEADDMMYLLQFTPVDENQDPIVLMNWRAHGTLMTNADVFSPDYIGSVRSYMEKADYRVCFLQGAAGNALPDSTVPNVTKWKVMNNWNTEMRSGFTYTNTDEKTLHLNYYGYLLTQVAQKCVMSELEEGIIRTSSSIYEPKKHKDTPVQIEGARYWYEHSGDITFPWTYKDGCVFDSYYHVKNTYERNFPEGKQQEENAAPMTVNAIMLGDQVAMVTCGNELSDRYTETDKLQYNTTTEQWYISGDDNDWKDLNDAVYGTPFVLAYTNGTHAYMPNYLSYEYNKDIPVCGGGCYESQTTPYAPGTGEDLIKEFGRMLDGLSGDAVLNGTYYDTLTAAIAAAEEAEGDSLITLNCAENNEDLTINKNLTIDFNGCTFTGEINVATGKTLYCMDSATADFDVEGDEVNGYSGFTKIPKANITGEGKVAGVPEGTNLIADGLQYVMIDDGANYSFHCVKLDTYAITVQAYNGNSENPSVYYTSDFAADEVVAAKVTQRGVALSIMEEPTAENFATKCLSTELMKDGEEFTAGVNNANSGNGTLLYNILNPNNAELVNRRNANTKVYGKAYMVVTDAEGNEEYLFGNATDNTADQTKGYSLKDAFEAANDSWNSSVKDPEVIASIEGTIKTYNAIMKNWSIKNIREAVAANDDELNILMIGNSFCYYYVEELCSMLAEQYPDKTVRVCNVYQSGRTLQEHWTHWKQGDAGNDYFFYITENSENTNNITKRTTAINGTGSLVECLEWEGWDWDVVSLQEASSKYISYSATTHYANSKTYLNDLWNLITEKAPFARRLWHATWSYQVGHPQTADTAAQTTAANRSSTFGVWACDDYGLEAVNTVTAWQNVRKDYGYDDLCRYAVKAPTSVGVADNDYYHDGDKGGGQYLNACVWYEVITGEDCRELTYEPSYSLNENISVDTLRAAAHQTVNPQVK